MYFVFLTHIIYKSYSNDDTFTYVRTLTQFQFKILNLIFLQKTDSVTSTSTYTAFMLAPCSNRNLTMF